MFFFIEINMHKCTPLYSNLSTKTECDYLNCWIKNSHTRKISPKVVNLRDIVGEGRRRSTVMPPVLHALYTGDCSSNNISSRLIFPDGTALADISKSGAGYFFYGVMVCEVE